MQVFWGVAGDGIYHLVAYPKFCGAIQNRTASFRDSAAIPVLSRPSIFLSFTPVRHRRLLIHRRSPCRHFKYHLLSCLQKSEQYSFGHAAI